MKRLPSWDQVRWVHVVGVCGTLMGAFAAYMRRRGLRVTGSDQNIYPPMSDVLRSAGVELKNGYRPENLVEGQNHPDVVIIGNVIRSDNPEARAAIDGGMAYASLPEAMETFFLRETRNLVVAGTHGKTTTSSMLAHTLVSAGRKPSYFIGGVSHDLPHAFHVETGGKYFVLEGDEYDTAFWDKVPKFNHYLPDDAILTSIEFDHADIYADLAAVERAFDGLMTRVRSGGRVIACLDDAPVRRVIEKAKVPVITYGRGEGNPRYRTRYLESKAGLERFEVLDAGKAVAELELQVPGEHNQLNSLAVWIECRELGVPDRAIRDALAAFRGVKRRQEERGTVRGVTVIDDFAHHPTAVRETLKAFKRRYAGRRVLVVFEPRSATSRRKIFQREYAQAFAEADRVYIAEPFDQSRIAEGDRFSSAELVGDLNRARGGAAALFSRVDDGVAKVASDASSGDVVAVLSNGGFEGFIPKLLERLAR